MPVACGRPALVVRLVSGYVWDTVIFPQLQQHLLGAAPPPRLGPPSASSVYVTDTQSIAVCRSAEDFAYRLSLRLNLPIPNQMYATLDPLQEMRLYGCVMFYFVAPPQTRLEVPPITAVHGIHPSNQGLTAGGAREWILHQNPSFDFRTMEAFVVNPSGARWGPIR